MNRKVVLADNYAKGQSIFAALWNIILIAFCIAIGLSLLFGARKDFLPLTILVFLILSWPTLFMLEELLLSNFGHEVISIEDGKLVIRRTGCMFRRHREIPMSSIYMLDYDEGETMMRGVIFPEHIKVYYETDRPRSLRFGLDMTDDESEMLKKQITDYANQYKQNDTTPRHPAVPAGADGE